MTSARRGGPAGGVPLSALHLRPRPWAGQGLRAAGRVSKDLSGPTAPPPPPWPSSDLITCKCSSPRSGRDHPSHTPLGPHRALACGSLVTLHSVQLDLAVNLRIFRMAGPLLTLPALWALPPHRLDLTVQHRGGPQFPSRGPAVEAPSSLYAGPHEGPRPLRWPYPCGPPPRGPGAGRG